MRIVHIDKFAPGTDQAVGGASRHLVTLMAHQRRRGHDVFSFGCAGDGSAALPRLETFSPQAGPGGMWRMIHNAEAARKLARWLDRNPVEVAHLHNIYHHLTPSILPVLARRGIGIVLTVHDYRLVCPTRHLYRPDGLCTRCVPNKFYHAASPRCAGVSGAALGVESFVQRAGRRYLRWVDLFLCPSRYAQGMLLAGGGARGKAVYVPHPVTLPEGEIRPYGGRATILYAGRLSVEKGPDRMLSLAERLPEARVLVAGEGPMGDELRRDVRRRGPANVKLLGWVDPQRLGELYAEAELVVIPSRCMENSPLTMLEAMAAGRCVVVPDQPPLREWVDDGRTGRTFATGDDEDLLRVCQRVLADGAADRRMARAGRELIASRHDPRAVMDTLDDLYEEAGRRCALRW